MALTIYGFLNKLMRLLRSVYLDIRHSKGYVAENQKKSYEARRHRKPKNNSYCQVKNKQPNNENKANSQTDELLEHKRREIYKSDCT